MASGKVSKIWDDEPSLGGVTVMSCQYLVAVLVGG